jgi:hypothetical protein
MIEDSTQSNRERFQKRARLANAHVAGCVRCDASQPKCFQGGAFLTNQTAGKTAAESERGKKKPVRRCAVAFA